MDRIRQIEAACSDMWVPSGGIPDFSGEIYDIYRRTGYIYHSPYRLAPSIPVAAGCGNLSFYRGADTENFPYMSGLGCYAFRKTVGFENLLQMFGIPDVSLEDYLDEILDDAVWIPIRQWPVQARFWHWYAGRSSWTKEPDMDGNISLARRGTVKKEYVLYRREKGGFVLSEIPSWRLENFRAENPEGTTDGLYRIELALAHRRKTMPPIYVKDTGGMVSLTFTYPMPPEENDFLKLYSWPRNYADYSLQAGRDMSKAVYLAVYPVLEKLGYVFEME